MKTKKTKQNKAIPANRALVLQEVALSPNQKLGVSQVTPEVFIKNKPGRGGKKVTYVEGGYVLSRLNAIFSPAGWDFRIVERGQTDRVLDKGSEGEVWVYGEITIHDHAKGYRVTKGQYGQHPIHKNTPIGDAYKAAATDALKKCASLFGIAGDVYWKITEQEVSHEAKGPEKPAKKTSVDAEDMKKIKKIVASTHSPDVLIAIDEKIKESPIYSKAQKDELNKLINSRVDVLQSNKQ